MELLNKARSIKYWLGQLYYLYKKKNIPKIDIDHKPKVLNLNIIDVCNSRCTMCNIWKNDEEIEISPDELEKVLSDELFSELEHVGITGGEPTLRKDLLEIYRRVIITLPNLKGLSIITNSIEVETIKVTIIDISELCKKHNIGFSVMVSIDGVGKIHDKVRGIKGNFDSSIKLLKFLKEETSIPIMFGCTISKINVWYVDELLIYMKDLGIHGRFRVAEKINRLYNDNRSRVIRNFDREESYHLVLFFEKLKITFETNQTIKRTYSSIQNILLGGKRTIGCPYLKDGVVMGSGGQISYCAPKSSIIGNSVKESAFKIYKSNWKEKERIIDENCDDCIHDYHAEITYSELLKQYKENLYNRFLRIESINKVRKLSYFINTVPRNKSKRVFIVGWYGTETVGDKAILGGIINEYKKKFDDVEFVIGSLFPFITEKTMEELGVEAEVVSTKTIDLIKYSKSSDEVVMGGGPLMDLQELYVPLHAFSIAKKYGNKRIVYGCGIGPLKSNFFRNTVIDILKLSDQVMLRDKNSYNQYINWGLNADKASLSGDLAKKYIESLQLNKNNENEITISCYLREWTYEYFDGSKEDFLIKKEKFEIGISNLIKNEADRLGAKKIILNHMHNFVVGNDDRDFSRYFISKYFDNEINIEFDYRLSTVESIAESMINSNLNICMRFHSVLFAHTLDTNFLAIDYTLGGKIHGYLKDNNSLDKEVTVEYLVDNLK